MNASDHFPADVFRRLTGAAAVEAESIGGGRNSRVFRVQTDDGRTYAVKSFFRSDADCRDRLGIETSVLRMLRECGFADVPRVEYLDAAAGVAVYEFVPGRKLPPQQITGEELAEVTRFIIRLQQSQVRGRFAEFPAASEACFSLAEIASHTERRFRRFAALSAGNGPEKDAVEFLCQTLRPFQEKAYAEACAAYAGAGLDPALALPAELRILSPSDFGFHNILKKADGGLCFLDFEYFGWDSPEKCINDFLLHPAVALARPLRGLFLERLTEQFAADRALVLRVRSSYRLFGVKWCLIFLNEFLRDDRQRREFAGQSCEGILEQQLGKAKALLRELTEEGFPY